MSSFSCLLDCFSYVTGVTPENLMLGLGHDGSEIIYPELPEPFCRRGFNVFELIDTVRYFEGIKLSFLLKEVRCENMWTAEPKITNKDLTSKYFTTSESLIAMTPSHAVVCHGGSVEFDPSTYHKLTYEQVLSSHIAIIF